MPKDCRYIQPNIKTTFIQGKGLELEQACYNLRKKGLGGGEGEMERGEKTIFWWCKCLLVFLIEAGSLEKQWTSELT